MYYVYVPFSYNKKHHHQKEVSTSWNLECTVSQSVFSVKLANNSSQPTVHDFSFSFYFLSANKHQIYFNPTIASATLEFQIDMKSK